MSLHPRNDDSAKLTSRELVGHVTLLWFLSAPPAPSRARDLTGRWRPGPQLQGGGVVQAPSPPVGYSPPVTPGLSGRWRPGPQLGQDLAPSRPSRAPDLSGRWRPGPQLQGGGVVQGLPGRQGRWPGPRFPPSPTSARPGPRHAPPPARRGTAPAAGRTAAPPATYPLAAHSPVTTVTRGPPALSSGGASRPVVSAAAGVQGLSRGDGPCYQRGAHDRGGRVEWLYY